MWRTLKKLLLVLLMFAAAAASGYWIKEFVDARNPQYAVPEMEVTADGQALQGVLNACSWDFLTGETCSYLGRESLFELEMPRNELLGGEQLEFRFSQTPQELTISRSERYSYDFRPCGENLTVPYESGVYLYEITAQFARGYELFYLYIAVM